MAIIMTAAAAAAAALSPQPAANAAYPIVELRQYTLHEGKRDTLIDLFEREFIESQEAVGMKVIGTFRDLDRPNRFVWLRGFGDMDKRLKGLSDFYYGPLWQAHREAANATIEDNDNVLLLHAPDAAAMFKRQPQRPALGETRGGGLVVATIDYLKGSPAGALSVFEREVRPRLERAGVEPLAWFVSETAANNFPRLPVRGDIVLVWFARFPSVDAHARRKAAIDRAAAPLRALLAKPPETLRLAPTARSELR